MIQELGVRGLIAETAQVVDGADETPAEDMMPESVRHHAGGQWVVRGGDLLGELEASAALGHEGLGVEDFQIAPRDDGRRLLVFAANEERHVEPFGLEEAGGAARDGDFGFQLAVFGGEGGELGRYGLGGVEDSVADACVEQRGLGLGGFITSPGGGGFG